MASSNKKNNIVDAFADFMEMKESEAKPNDLGDLLGGVAELCKMFVSERKDRAAGKAN